MEHDTGQSQPPLLLTAASFLQIRHKPEASSISGDVGEDTNILIKLVLPGDEWKNARGNLSNGVLELKQPLPANCVSVAERTDEDVLPLHCLTL